MTLMPPGECEGEEAFASSVCGGCGFAAHLGGITVGDRVLLVGRLVVQTCVLVRTTTRVSVGPTITTSVGRRLIIAVV